MPILLIIILALTSACSTSNDPSHEMVNAEETSHKEEPKQPEKLVAKLNPRVLVRFKPLDESSNEYTEERTQELVDLGRMLYYEKRLSKSQEISCNSCHPLDKYGVDSLKTPVGHGGAVGGRNTPTVYNSNGAVAQFWDGRATDLEEQATGPIQNPAEMASSRKYVLRVLKSMPEYVAAFKAAFPNERKPISFDSIAIAIAAFEMGLVTPSRWDMFLKGQSEALTEEEKLGLQTFTSVGCMVCHTGEMLGNSTFAKAGVVHPWPNQQDKGKGEVTNAEGDEMMFKVPSLRNIAKTAPYFHDGSVATLEEAVDTMAHHQLGINLSEEERTYIIAWLNSLTGQIPQEYIQEPNLPKSTRRTPKAKK